MFELQKKENITELVMRTKSDSGVAGPDLALTHIELGKRIAKYLPVDPKDTTVIAIMRGGIFFAQGIYFELQSQFEIFDPKHQAFNRPKTKFVVLADAVINTGRTIQKIMQKDFLVACNVIFAGSVPSFGKNLFAVRVSSNTFIGSNVQKQINQFGPDTTMRLFNQLGR